MKAPLGHLNAAKNMLKLEDIKKNAAVAGLEPGQVVRIVATEAVGDSALTAYYKTADGSLRERMLFRTDETKQIGRAHV